MSFAYDAAGFRVKRELTIDRSRSAAKSNAKRSALYDSLGDKIVKLNLTTSGEVIVSLENYSENDVCNIHIFDSRGDLMLTNTLNGAVNTIDLKHFVSGIYMCRITVNNQETVWKIALK